MSDVVIEVNRGMVTAVYSDANLRFVLIDWDLNQRLEPGVTLGSIMDSESITSLPKETRAEYENVVA